jgi:uncharacterized protein (DUF488 family)
MAEAYSIGYGNRELEEFLKLVESYGIRYLLDVRSSPYSRFSPDFNQASLEHACAAKRIKYVFVGDQLGGRPQKDRCYDDEGRVDYTRLAEEPYFVEGVRRLETAIAKNLDFVLMCSELRPEQCHRSKLIGKVLEDHGIRLRHIDADGGLVDQAAVIERITGGQRDLFGDAPDVSRSRGSYRTIQNND